MIRVFGSKAFAHVPKSLRHKLDPHSKPYIFVGYSSASKAYVLDDPVKQREIVSSEVTFVAEGDYSSHYNAAHPMAAPLPLSHDSSTVPVIVPPQHSAHRSVVI
jgi:hypothetical protein